MSQSCGLAVDSGVDIIKSICDDAPPLTEATRAKLAALLIGGAR